MELIINFYKGLDTLNLIIFWGIIIIIILLLIFSFILINKNKKLKELIENQNKYEDELPVKKDEEQQEPIILIDKEKNDNFSGQIELEEEFIPQDLVSPDRNDDNLIDDEEEKINSENIKKDYKVELPKAPYQRNVLREMALSQTSPIGINRIDNNIDKKNEAEKDLEQSLDEEIEDILSQEDSDNIEQIPENKISEDNKNERYLEEVSRKLSEAEIPDEIERTNYELKQEEEAIISYKELMEKKDTIQTIDEEEAIISIEELMNRKNHQQEVNDKLYKLTEEEPNDDFINELKQFRNDL